MLFLGWIGFSIGVSFAASARGRSAGEWFFVSIFLSPLVAAILLLLLPIEEKESASSEARKDTPAEDLRVAPEYYVDQIRKSWSLVQRQVISLDEHFAKVREMNGQVLGIGFIGTDTDFLAGAADLVEQGALTPGGIVLLKDSLEKRKAFQTGRSA